MKNKSKKIFAGLGLGLIMATTGLLATGCSSDITFNQSDLDAVLSGGREYFETQNNYNGNVVRRILLDYLVDETKSSFEKKDDALVITNSIKNSYLSAYVASTYTAKINRSDDGVIKLYYKNDESSHGTVTSLEEYYELSDYGYKMSELGGGMMSSGFGYGKVEKYENSTIGKTHTIETNVFENQICEMFGTYTRMRSSAMVSMIMTGITCNDAESNFQGLSIKFSQDVVMKVDGTKTQFTVPAVGSDGNETFSVVFNLTFENDKLSKVEMVISGYDDNGNFAGSQIVEINYPADSTITFDKTGYPEA